MSAGEELGFGPYDIKGEVTDDETRRKLREMFSNGIPAADYTPERIAVEKALRTGHVEIVSSIPTLTPERWDILTRD